MTNFARNVVRYLAAPAIIGGAALGLAGTAAATPSHSTPTTTVAPGPAGPGYQYSPEHYAPAAPTQSPGWQNHHGPTHMK